MARPKKHRRINCNPSCYYFKPKGIPMSELEEVILEGDELEAIRLGDLQNMSQEDAAVKMNISRQTFGRIVNKARAKIADSIINGKAIKLSEEISNELKSKFQFVCSKCGYKLRLRNSSGRVSCPHCNN